MSRLTADAGRDCRTRLARPNFQARTNADREIFISPVQLTTSRIGYLTRLIHALAVCITIHILFFSDTKLTVVCSTSLASRALNKSSIVSK